MQVANLLRRLKVTGEAARWLGLYPLMAQRRSQFGVCAAPMMAVSMVLIGSGLVIAAVRIGLDTSLGAVLLPAAMLIFATVMMLEFVG